MPATGPAIPARTFPAWDRRLWVWIGPYAAAVAVAVWLGSSGTLALGVFILAAVLMPLASTTPGTALWYALDDAKKGYTGARSWQRQVCSVVPLIVAVTVLGIAALLSSTNQAQLLLSLCLILVAALPGAIYAAIKIHQNRDLPYRGPKTSPLEP